MKKEKNRKYEEKIQRLEQAVQDKGVSVSDEIHHELFEILNKNESGFPEGSAKQLLWEQQKKAASLANSKQMR